MNSLTQQLRVAAVQTAHGTMPQSLLAAPGLLWSAGFGNQQVTWSSIQRVVRAQHTDSSSGSGNPAVSEQQHASAPASLPSQSDEQQLQGIASLLQKQLQLMRQDTKAAIGHMQQPAEPLSALNFTNEGPQPSSSAASAAEQLGMPARQPLNPETVELAAAAAAAAHEAQALSQEATTAVEAQQIDIQQQQQQQTGDLQPSTTAAITTLQLPPAWLSKLVRSESFQDLLALVVNHPERLLPWQTTPYPTMQQLEQYERLKLSGSHKASKVKDEAFEQRAMLIRRFSQSKGLAQHARAAQIPKPLLPHASAAFRKFLGRSATPGLSAAILMAAAPPQGSLPGTPLQQHAAAAAAKPAEDAAAPAVSDGISEGVGQGDSAGGIGGGAAQSLDYTPAVEALLMPYFVQFCRQQYKQEIDSYVAAVATLDLRSPHTWYPYARAIKRKIIYHGGPTNSGKTYNALQSLAAAERGLYCAPLRLLAMEVYETLNHMGVYCDLVTGQEVLRVPGSRHVSCTVEMASINMHADVAVIDEIQLIGDDQRGFAWSRALLGLPANTIHVCGDTSAVKLVQHMAGLCGDDFELHTYDRMTPLHCDESGLPNGWADVQPGDAVVAFSRKNIYKARKAIEAATGQRTCIVYGALPAETRRHQARLFNDPHSGVDVLVASDAIGLGLNFNIRRVIFTTMSKHSRMGRGMVPVPVSLIKQIAGRAGRRNSIYPEGCVTTFQQKDLPALKQALSIPIDKLYTPAAGLAPEYETIELLSAQFPDLTLEQLLRKLDSEARLDGRYFLCNQEQLLETARVLGRVQGLSLPDQFTLVNAPIDPLDFKQRRAFLEFTNTYAAGHPVVFNEALMPAGPPVSEVQMAEAESLHKILALWLWLSFRFEEGSFPGRERVQAMARTLSHWLNIGLDNIQAAAAREAAAAMQAAAEGVAGSSSSGDGGERVDSTDADEVNETVFETPVIEVSPRSVAAAGVSAFSRILVADGAAASSGSIEQETTKLLQQKYNMKPSKQQTPPAVAYINWGSTIVSSDATGFFSSGGSIGTTGSGSYDAADTAATPPASTSSMDGLLPAESLETSYAAGTNHSVEVLEQLIMPELDPSMVPFIRWKARPRFVAPPAPTQLTATQ